MKRYQDRYERETGYYGMVEHEIGDYVFYDDAQAEIDKVMEKAIQFATATISDVIAEGTVKQAEAFLDSTAVREWRARQKDK